MEGEPATAPRRPAAVEPPRCQPPFSSCLPRRGPPFPSRRAASSRDRGARRAACQLRQTRSPEEVQAVGMSMEGEPAAGRRRRER